MRILALDIGTSSVKAAVLAGTEGEPLERPVHVAYDLDHPTPDAAEVPAERVWQALTAAARQATRRYPEVAAIGLSCMMPALVLLDARDQPLAPVWTHLDRRARPAARHVWQTVGDEFLATVGNLPLPGGISATCFRQQVTRNSYILCDVRGYLHLNGWLGLKLTGEKAFDPANASFSGLFGTVTDQRWSERWCRYFEVEPDWLPTVQCGSATLGHLRPAVAAELGTPAGIPVKLGTADTSSAWLAAGARRGDLLHVVGTTQVLSAIAETPRPHPRRLTRLLGVGPEFLHVTHNPVGGGALCWLRDLCFRDQTEEEFYEQTIPQALGHPTRVTLDPPYLGGDRLEIEAHRAAFRDLTLASDRLDLLAALLQALRHHHRQAVQNLGLGEHFARVFLTGGGADVIHRLLPEYAAAAVSFFDEGSLRGVAKLLERG
ncbi:MAG: FGGY-family carbohydrate kinase [Gemmataceae bacterium]